MLPRLDPADLDFLKNKAEECKEKQNNPLLCEGQVNPYIKLIVVLEQSLREGKTMARTKPLRKQLQADREKLMSVGTRKVIVPKSLSMISHTTIAASPGIVCIPSKVPSTISFDVFASSPVITPRAQLPHALLTGSPGVVPFQVHATEDHPFPHELRSRSTVTVVTAPSTITATTGNTALSREQCKAPSEETIPLEAKETKRRGRPKILQKASEHRPHEKKLSTRGEMKEILMAKGMEKWKKAIEVDRDKDSVIAKENI